MDILILLIVLEEAIITIFVDCPLYLYEDKLCNPFKKGNIRNFKLEIFYNIHDNVDKNSHTLRYRLFNLSCWQILY